MPFGVKSSLSPSRPQRQSRCRSRWRPFRRWGRACGGPSRPGSPSFIFSQISLPSFCSTGATSSRNCTPSAMASSAPRHQRACTSWCGGRPGCWTWHRPAGRPGGVHGGVAAADYGHMAQRHFLAGLHVLEPADDGHHIAGDVQLAGLPGAHGEEDVGVALALSSATEGPRY